MTHAEDEFAGTMRSVDLVRNADLIACRPLNFRELVSRLWDEGLPAGDSTGWPSIDRHYTVVPGQLTIITGWPGSGKSEWLDAVVLNLCKRGWRFAMFSPENTPAELHIVKFAEKFLGKPVRRGPTERATKDEVFEAMTEIEDWISLLLPTSTTERLSFGVEDVLNAAELHFRQSGIWHSRESKRGLVIDPWNEVEQLGRGNLSETEYIGVTLGRIRAWARASNVHVWIVAHPQKLYRDRDSGKLPIPKPDSISGSQHWWNKADNCITVWRPLDEQSQAVQFHVQKVRFKHIGSAGMVELNYDRVTGRYFEQLHLAKRLFDDAA